MDEENESTQGEATSMDYPTLFIPKSDDYAVPDSGRAMVDFKKVSEDENGCTVQLTSFESEKETDETSIDDDMEDAMDHVDSFITKREKKQSEDY